jgi:uncharacterized integral membrane protein
MSDRNTGNIGAVRNPEARDTEAGPSTGPGRSGAGGLWVGLVVSAIVLVLLLIFVLQNPDPARIAFLGWDGTLPTGVALLFAAVGGVLLVALPGSLRIVQLRRQARRGSRTARGEAGPRGPQR